MSDNDSELTTTQVFTTDRDMLNKLREKLANWFACGLSDTDVAEQFQSSATLTEFGRMLCLPDLVAVIRILMAERPEEKPEGMTKAELTKALKAIVPGKTYPRDVTVFEPDGRTVQFMLQSYLTGMYCSIALNGVLQCQTGDHNNKTLCTKLKGDLIKAQKRGARIEIGPVVPVKKDDADV